MELSDAKIAELVARYRAHRISSRDPRRCAACPSRYQCFYRIQARDILLAAGLGYLLAGPDVAGLR